MVSKRSFESNLHLYIEGVPKKKDPASVGAVVLPHPVGTRGIVALGFSRDGDKLVSVGADNEHTVFVWRWRSAAGGGAAW